MYRVLSILKDNKSFVSGEKIGIELGVSRASVWKNIKKLQNEGYNIESVTNKGYRLIEDNSLNCEEIMNTIPTKFIGKEIIFLLETDSTNTQLKKIGHNNGNEGTVVIAETMTHGRGRLGRTWIAPKFTGLWFSILLRPNILPQNASTITLLAGIATALGIEKSTNLKANIKWPNDIIINNKKVCGILTEMDCEIEKINFIILGIGLNVNIENFPEELKDIATSLFLESGSSICRNTILTNILIEFEKLYTEFVENNNGFSHFCELYESKCINIGNKIRVFGKEIFDGTGIKITEDGGLLVKRDDTGEEVLVVSGEVSIRNI